MSLASDAIALTSSAWNTIHADVWGIVSGTLAGTSFEGDAQTEAPVILNTDLGEDAREKTVLFCFRPAPEIGRGIIISGLGATWRIVDREDNPANSRVKFEILKIAARDNQ